MPAEKLTPIPAAKRAFRRRHAAITAILLGLAVLIVVLGAAAVEAIDVLRANSVAGFHWSKAETSAVVDLIRYIDTHEAERYTKFQNAIRVIASDRRAREAVTGERLDYAGALQAFEDGGNDKSDAPGLTIALYLFRDWPPYAAALDDWRNGEKWIGELARLGEHIHRRILAGADESELGGDLAQVDFLAAKLADNERRFLAHVSAGSMRAKHITLFLFASLSGAAVIGCLWLAWRILRVGMASEIRAIASEKRVRDYAELATDFFCEIDSDFRFSYVSALNPDKQKNILRWLQGRRLLDVSGLRRIEGPQLGQTPGEHRAFRRLLFELTGDDGSTTHWSVSGNPLFEENGRFAGYRVVATDISEFMATQSELTRARDEAVSANRAKSAFLANMSHELRTPLNAILGFSQMIENQLLGPLGNLRYGEYARDVRRSGEHLLSIINDLLDHSRIEAGQMKLTRDCFVACEVVEEAIGLCRPQADALHVALTSDVEPALPCIAGDRLRLKQALINIVTNAIKFSPGGSVNLAMRRDAVSKLKFVIADTGIGMDASGIAQALRPFGQVDSGLNRKYEGTGLGVPLSKSLVELQGGTFAIESEKGKGTRVTIMLPFETCTASDKDSAIAAR